ncbi:MAG: YciI family protein [Alphaproteobacteria bacterium]|nr:MAG: YciI family protein [Alphaproteobacteria bacterium]
MHVIIYCRDKADSLNLRLANREDHLKFVGEHLDKVKVAGPLIAEDGETMIGSMLLMEFATLAEAEDWSQQDPYRKAGLFERVEITEINWTLGKP